MATIVAHGLHAFNQDFVSVFDVATGLVTIPNRYMHSPVEMISLDDLDNAAKLIAHFCLSLTPQCDFTP